MDDDFLGVCLCVYLQQNKKRSRPSPLKSWWFAVSPAINLELRYGTTSFSTSCSVSPVQLATRPVSVNIWSPSRSPSNFGCHDVKPIFRTFLGHHTSVVTCAASTAPVPDGGDEEDRLKLDFAFITEYLTNIQLPNVSFTSCWCINYVLPRWNALIFFEYLSRQTSCCRRVCCHRVYYSNMIRAITLWGTISALLHCDYTVLSALLSRTKRASSYWAVERFDYYAFGGSRQNTPWHPGLDPVFVRPRTDPLRRLAPSSGPVSCQTPCSRWRFACARRSRSSSQGAHGGRLSRRLSSSCLPSTPPREPGLWKEGSR